jgi:hypothetical protein
MYYPGEILWPQFTQLDWIRRLPLNEQVIHYNRYLEELGSWNHHQGGGASLPESDVITEDSSLLLEDGDYLLQENGSKIYI